MIRRVLSEETGLSQNELLEAPSVPNHYDFTVRDRPRKGMVITVEPIISVSASKSMTAEDGWTERTADGSLAAHFEHTIVITE